MLKSLFIASVLLGACAPSTHNTTPVYVGGAGRAQPAAKTRAIAMRGKVPRGKRVEYVVAVQIDTKGKRRRIRVRPAADGSYALRLPPGHRYAMAYEDRGRLVGNVSFPSQPGRPPSTTINLSQNVVVNQQYIDLGEPTYVGGVFVAAADPGQYLDNDGDGVLDYQDGDDDGDGLDDNQDPDASADIVADASAFDGDFEDVEESAIYDDGGADEVAAPPDVDADPGDNAED
jgi:hypothetical protein